MAMDNWLQLMAAVSSKRSSHKLTVPLSHALQREAGRTLKPEKAAVFNCHELKMQKDLSKDFSLISQVSALYQLIKIDQFLRQT